MPANLLPFLTLILITLSLQCTNYYNFPSSGCTFNFYNPYSTCDSLNFINCTWQQCGAQYYNYTLGAYVCIYYIPSYKTIWDSCTQQCCGGDGYPQTWDFVRQCQNQLDSTKTANYTIIIITMSVIGGLAVIVVVVIFGLRRCRQIQNEQQVIDHTATNMMVVRRWGNPGVQQFARPNMQQYQMQQLPHMAMPGLSKYQQILQQSQIKLTVKWMDVPDLPQKFNECCSVCLDNKVNLQLQCGHCYHRKCIVACIHRKIQCILCRSANINHIKVFCQLCLRCYYPTTLMDHVNELATGVVCCPKCIHANAG